MKKLYILLINLIFTATGITIAQQQNSWQWARQLGSNGWDITSGVVCNSKNELFVTGSFQSTLRYDNKKLNGPGGRDIFIAKLNDQGKVKQTWICGSRKNDEATCISYAKGDNILIAGDIGDSAVFGNLKENHCGGSLFITCLNAKGSFSWIATFEKTAEASLSLMSTDGIGNIYAAGSFSGSLTAGNLSITTKGRKDVFLMRLNATGKVEKLINLGSEDDDIPGSLSVSAAGNVSLSLSYTKTVHVGDSLLHLNFPGTKMNTAILGLNSEFKIQWVQHFGAEDFIQISSTGYDKKDNLYVTGNFNLKMYQKDTTFISKGYTDCFLIKFSSNGKTVWRRSFGTWYYDYSYHILPNYAGGATITGVLGDTLQVDTLSITPMGHNTAMVLQFSPQGKAIWGDYIPGKGRNFSSGAVLDKKGNLYMAGSFTDSFEKEGEALQSYGDQDVFLAKYFNCVDAKTSIAGDTQFCPGKYTILIVSGERDKTVWNDTIFGTTYLEVTNPGTYWVTQYDRKGCQVTDTVEVSFIKSEKLDLGPDTTITVNDSLILQSSGDFSGHLWQDFSTNSTFVAKSDQPGKHSYWLSAIDSKGCSGIDTITITFDPVPQWVNGDAKLTGYPNPTTSLLNWYLTAKDRCKLVLEVADGHGRILYQEYIENYSPGEVKQINLEKVPVGPYLVQVKSQGRVITTLRIVKQ